MLPRGNLGSGVTFGGVAQLGERLLCKQEVIGSIPFASTTSEVSGQKSEIRISGLFRHLTEVTGSVSYETF